MIKPALFRCLVVSLLLLYSPSLYGSETYIFSGNPNAPPVVWEQNQELVGLAPDLAETIFKSLEIPYQLRRFGDWQNVQLKAQKGEIDMILSAYKNNEREAYLHFSDPYLSQPTVILVEKGKEFSFSSWDSLIGKKGVSNRGESYGEKFDRFIGEKLDVSYHGFERAIQVLNLGEADYMIIDLYTALIYVKLLQGEDAVTILDPPVTVQNFHFAIHKDSELAARLPEINAKIQENLHSSTIEERLLSHFDSWQKLINQRSAYLAKQSKSRSERQVEYLKEQEEMARQRVLRTMVDREGLPPAAQ